MENLLDLLNKQKELSSNKNSRQGDITSPSTISDNLTTRYIDFSQDLTKDKPTGYTAYGDEESYGAYGVTINPVNTIDELNAERARNQSFISQFGNFLIQAGVGEVALGSLEGAGNIYDGLHSLITGGDYDRSAWTKFFEEARENLKNNFQIYRENPNENFDFSDTGWWFDNAVSVASTASLMIPALGWARALNYVGKVTKLGKAVNWATNTAFKAASKSSRLFNKGIDVGTKFSTLRNAARVSNSIKKGSEIATMAFLSRTGENYMEAKEVYDETYANSLENLKNMDNNEYMRLINSDDKFKNEDGTIKTDEEIANIIATESANKTFYNDYWMLGMDIMQFKALGSLWGKGVFKGDRVNTVRARIAAENAKRKLAGITNEQLIKDTFLNRRKEAVKYMLKNPKDSFTALELGEGFEEMFQGIQTEKGKEVAKQYFDPTFTPRSIISYLSDTSIWEQGFWGAIGGVAFNKLGGVVRKGYRNYKLYKLYKSKKITKEQYDAWKASEDKIAIEQLNNSQQDIDNLIYQMETISLGQNPFNFYRDPQTGEKVIKDGKLVLEEIDEEQKDLLMQEAIDQFVINTTMKSIDNGSFKLMRDILNSPEFDKYIEKYGKKITTTDKALNVQITKRMNEIKDIYSNSLNNVYRSIDDVNPFVANAVSRYNTRQKLIIGDIDREIKNIDNELDRENENYKGYEELALYEVFNNRINQLNKDKDDYDKLYKEGKLDKEAYDRYIKEINKEKSDLINYLYKNTSFGAIDNIKNVINKTAKEYDITTTSNVLKELDNYIKKYKEENKQEEISDNTKQLINQKINAVYRKTITESQVESNSENITDSYNEFSRAMEQSAIKRIEDYVNKFEEYLKNADDIDEAINNFLNHTTGNKELTDAAIALKYGYLNPSLGELNIQQSAINKRLSEIIEEAKNKINKENKKAEKTEKEANKKGISVPDPKEASEVVDTPKKKTSKNAKQTSKSKTAKKETKAVTLKELNKQKAEKEKEAKKAKESAKQDYPSTGKGTQTEPANTTNTAKTDKPAEKETEFIDGYTEIDDSKLGDKEVLNAEAESYNSRNIIISTYASKYIITTWFKDSNRINKINEGLKNNNRTELDKFINEIAEELSKQNFNPIVTKPIIEEEFNRSANIFIKNKDNKLKQLAEQLKLGINKATANKYSVTELIDGKGLDSVVEEFLEEYLKTIGSSLSTEGFVIVNVNHLFDYLLNEEKISYNDAIYIYQNLGKYIGSYNGTKYVFTGFLNNGQALSSNEFFNRLLDNKSQSVLKINELHVHPVEEKYRDKDYDKAVIEAHNGGEVYAKIESNAENENSNIGIYINIKKGNKSKTVKLGILRTVSVNKDLTIINPIAHASGFANKVIIKDDVITLDCDDFFESIINHKENGKDAEEIFRYLEDYYIKLRKYIKDNKQGLITDNELKKLLDNLINNEKALQFINNPLIQNILQNEVYKIHSSKLSNAERASKIINTIGNILFYGQGFSENSSVSDYSDNFDTSKLYMQQNYNNWKLAVYNNYTLTYKLQEQLKTNNKINIKARVNTYTTIKHDSNNIKNITELPFNPIPNNEDYTPLVMVNKNRELIDEYGNNYGYANPGINPFSIGYLLGRKDDRNYVAYIDNATDISNSKLANGIKEELKELMQMQFSNTSSVENRDDVFRDIVDKINNLFNPKGLFKFNGLYSVTANNEIVSIYRRTDKDIKNCPKLATFYRLTFAQGNNKNRTPSTCVSILNKNGEQINIYNNEYAVRKVNGLLEKLSTEEIKETIDDFLNEVVKDLTLNKSSVGMNFDNSAKSYSLLDITNGQFNIKLGGKEYKYANYGDFILKNKGFTTDAQYSNGSFFEVTKVSDNIYIDIDVKENQAIDLSSKKSVSDLLFSKDKERPKTALTEHILDAAGVSQEQKDILFGVTTGVQLLNKIIYMNDTDNGDTNMFYNAEDKRIYITPKGAKVMDNNPQNAVRLLLHENIHRIFQNKRHYDKETRQRILNDLTEVYSYLREKLNEDVIEGRINNEFYSQVINVLDKATSSDDLQRNMEEFLVECLTQRNLMNYLNNTDYKEEVNIDGIKKRRTILQKIIDILLELFGINKGKIKNNTILAKQYLILSNISNNNSNNSKEDNVTLPVEGTSSIKSTSKSKKTTSNNNKTILNQTKATIDKIRKDFESKITRSENFEEDHTYYINGEKVDYSVTQKIHGKTDIGEWGVPSSTLGNTADNAARLYFQNGNRLPSNVTFPNVRNIPDTGLGIIPANTNLSLQHEIDKIKNKLDEMFGKGNYGVITDEFPIGGTIEVNGEIKTIAGTMDMIVYTNKGEIYIFDFKTKHFNNNTKGQLSNNNILGYTQQVNIYRQLLEANYPELKGKIKIGGLFVFTVDYPSPSDKIKYRVDPNNKDQLQISVLGTNFENIQDETITYMSPRFINNEILTTVETKDYPDKIDALPEPKEINVEKVNKEDIIIDDETLENYDADIEAQLEADINNLDIENELIDSNFMANTEMIDANNMTSTEIYASDIANGIVENPYGIKVVNDINDFVNTFPIQYHADIKQMVDSDGFNYTCK